QQPGCPLPERLRVHELTPEMHRECGELEERVSSDKGGSMRDLVDRHAELDPALAGRDVWVSVGGDVRVDPDADRDRRSFRFGNTCESLELFAGFDIEVTHADAHGLPELVRRLADSAEDDAGRIESGGQNPRQLAAGHDVCPGTELPQDPKNRERAVGLDR